MKTKILDNIVNTIGQIEVRITQVQKTNITLQEQLKQEQNNFVDQLNASLLRIIEIVDMTSAIRSNINLDNNTNLHLVINKIEKQLLELLDEWQVQEIMPTDRLEPNKIRVIETRPANDISPTGTIIEVCRKGYQRGEQIIRPVDVITSKSIDSQQFSNFLHNI